jgi:hypothetical protein
MPPRPTRAALSNRRAAHSRYVRPGAALRLFVNESSAHARRTLALSTPAVEQHVRDVVGAPGFTDPAFRQSLAGASPR